MGITVIIAEMEVLIDLTVLTIELARYLAGHTQKNGSVEFIIAKEYGQRYELQHQKTEKSKIPPEKQKYITQRSKFDG